MTAKHVFGSIAMVWVLMGCSEGGAHAKDAATDDDGSASVDAATRDAGRADADAAQDAGLGADAGADACAQFAWLDGMFTCDDGNDRTCAITYPRMGSSMDPSCLFMCTWSPDQHSTYFFYAGGPPPSLVLHAPDRFEFTTVPGTPTCTKH